MERSEKLRVSNEIKEDIRKGVFDSILSVKVKFIAISEKLTTSYYVVNSNIELSDEQMYLIKEYSYL